MTTIPRFLTVPRGSFFLFVPRGTGKTTWLREALPDALVVDLLRAEEYRRFGGAGRGPVALASTGSGEGRRGAMR